MSENSGNDNYIELTADIVSAYVSNNSVQANDIPSLINQVHTALLRVSSGQNEAPMEPILLQSLLGLGRLPARVHSKDCFVHKAPICFDDLCIFGR